MIKRVASEAKAALKHVRYYEGYTKNQGIKGAHEQINFFKASKAARPFKKISRKKVDGVPGVYHIKYQFYTLDKANNIVSNSAGVAKMAGDVHGKTVYSLKNWPDKKMIKAGKEAVLDAIRRDNFRFHWKDWGHGYTNQGFRMIGHNQDNKIKSYFFDYIQE